MPPATFTNEPVVFGLRLIMGAVFAMLVVAPLILQLDQITLLTEFLTALTLAMMWNLLAGYANIVTVGQHALVGVGAYAFYGFAVLVDLHPMVAIILAGFVALAVSVPMMAFVFRLRHAYFAIGTWVVAQVILLIAGKLPGFGGGGGTSIPAAVVRELGATANVRYVVIFFMTLTLAFVGFAGSFLLLRSRFGIGLTAMRDNEEAASAVGVPIARARIVSFLWVAPFLGIAGALIALQKIRITPESSFSLVDWTGIAMFIVIIGGIGSLEGPIIGAIIYFALRHYLADFGSWYLIALGATAILIMIAEPGGIWGLVRRRLGGDIFPVAHRLQAS